MGRLSEINDDISRFEMHQKLGTWHFNLNRTELDYEIVKHIDKPDNFWTSAIDEILENESTSLNNGFFLKNEIQISDASDQAIKSFQNDVKNMNSPLSDNWFDRRKITSKNIFFELTKEFDLDFIDMRLATQHPMDMTYRHIDHEHQQFVSNKEGEDKFETVEDCFKSRGDWRKYIILVHDLYPGQVFYWGNSIINAKKGDVIAWDYGVPHWTVNFSNLSRHSLMITGKKKT